ncbi:MAG TPA: methyltransferase domain-containing protein [Balneolales bacterium]|nr:methyltransferase domain-containing protein [Balneolales bacterium]
MSKIAYDPVKDRFASQIRHGHFLRTVFYRLLDMFFLRGWYVRDILRKLWRDHYKNSKQWKLLDAGCGFGQYDSFLLRSFSNVSIKSVDVKEDYLSDCRNYFKKEMAQDRIKFDYADLLEFHQEPEFDAALCVDVLEHIEDDVRVMTNIANSLKDGGHFVMHSPSHIAGEDAGEDEFFVEEHARAGYSKEELEEKLRKAGFKSVDIKYTYGTFGHAGWVILIKYPMLWLTRAGLAVMPVLFLYYLITLLPGLFLLRLDMMSKNDVGAGICALAQK